MWFADAMLGSGDEEIGRLSGNANVSAWGADPVTSVVLVRARADKEVSSSEAACIVNGVASGDKSGDATELLAEAWTFSFSAPFADIRAEDLTPCWFWTECTPLVL